MQKTKSTGKFLFSRPKKSQENKVEQLFTTPENAKINFLSGNMWTRYTLALLLIAGLSTSAFFIMNNLLGINEKSGVIVNVSGRQRMLSQRGALFALRLVAEQDPEAKALVREELTKVADLMLKSHEGLINGNKEMGLPSALSDTMRKMYFEQPNVLDEQVRNYVKTLNNLLVSDSYQRTSLDSPYLQYILNEAPNRLLRTLNAAVKQYEVEASTEIQKAMRWEEYVYITTLLTLLLEGLLIFKPIIKRVKTTTEALVKEKQFSENVINTSQALIIAVDQTGDIALFNQYAQELSGWSAQDAIGKNFFELFIPEAEQKQLRQTYSTMFAGQAESTMETPFTIRSGDQLTVEWSNTLIKDPASQKPLLVCATGIDVTVRKLVMESLSSALEQSAILSDRLQQEVVHAALLQKAMLPEPAFQLPGIHGLVKLTTSTEVGGDYYDYYEVDGRHSVFLVGDVSGHGVAAGILVSAAKMSVHQLLNQGETDPAAMLEHINNALLAVRHESMFMTMLCCSLDGRTGHCRIANAGHVFPYLWTAQTESWSVIEAEGLPLGKVEDPVYKEMSLELKPNDRLFMFTDGIVEEESPEGKAFGFDAIEELLYDVLDAPMPLIQKIFFERLRAHCQSDTFSDDVTLMLVEHTQRIAYTTATPTHAPDKQDLIQISGNDFLDYSAERLGESVSRQHVVVTYDEGQMIDLLPQLCVHGIRRVLPAQQEFMRELGWQKLLHQHRPIAGDDVFQWLPHPDLQRQYVLSHSDDKQFILQEITGLLQEETQLSIEMQGIVILMADELLENSLYGAPRDGQNRPLYAKGTERDISPSEGIRIDLVKDDKCLGLMVTDHWGTFTPVIFLKRLLLNTAQAGLEAGIGGAGMYLIWRICDYLQVRVYPQQKTQVTLLWSLTRESSHDSDNGFQFFYHNELNEAMSEADVLEHFESYSEDIIDKVSGNQQKTIGEAL